MDTSLSWQMRPRQLKPLICGNCKTFARGRVNHFSSILADHEFLTGCYLLTVFSSDLLFSYGAVKLLSQLHFHFSINRRHSIAEKRTFLILWWQTLTCDLNLQIWPRYGQDEPACQICNSKIISFSFKHYCPTSQTNTKPTAVGLHAPLKWSIKIIGPISAQ